MSVTRNVSLGLVGNARGGRINLRGGVHRAGTIVTCEDTHEVRQSTLEKIVAFDFSGRKGEGQTAEIGGNRYVVRDGALVPQGDREYHPDQRLPLRTMLGSNATLTELSMGHAEGDLRIGWMLPGGGALLIYPKGLRIAPKLDRIRLTGMDAFDLNCFRMPDDMLWAYLRDHWGGAHRAFAGQLAVKHSDEIGAVVKRRLDEGLSASPLASETQKEPAKEASAPSDDGEAPFVAEECVICLGAEPECVFKPCRHACACLGCSELLSAAVCPMCRAHVRDIFPLNPKYLPSKNKAAVPLDAAEGGPRKQ